MKNEKCHITTASDIKSNYGIQTTELFHISLVPDIYCQH